MKNNLEFCINWPLITYLAGLQISRGTGQHQDRVIGCFDLLFVVEGTLLIQEEQRAFEVKAGQTLLLWPQRHHWGTGPFSPDMRLYWLHFDITPRDDERQQSGQERGEDWIEVPQYTSVVRPNVLESLFRRYLDDQATQRLNHVYASLLIRLMLCEIADSRVAGATERHSAVLAGQAHTFIRSHLHLPLSASVVAEYLGYHPEYLNRVFHLTYGHTLTHEIHLSRLGYARYLLLHTSHSIKEIAVSCGFSDANYFARLFKRYEGMTAQTFRRLHAQTEVNYE